MSHFGLLCPPTSGHINPMATLGRTLRRRGHRVTMFQLPELRDRVEREGLEFFPVAEGRAEAGELSAAVEQLGKLSGLAALRFTIRSGRRLAALILDTAPAAIRSSGIELALIDQNDPAGATVADHLRLPFISVAAALPLNREATVPPPFVPWMYRNSLGARMRNRLGYALTDFVLGGLMSTLNHQRKQWGLKPLRIPDDSFSSLGQLCTLPKLFDFPRAHLPRNFHYTGPFIDSARPAVAFPWERLDGRPLVYASFGTLQNRRPGQFRALAEACAGLNVQLVISAGGGDMAQEELPGSPLQVGYAPQLELLSKAALAITHAGLNTVLEALAAGVPMIAVPVTNDQPAVAARVQASGCGEVAGPNVTAEVLRRKIGMLLSQESYRERAVAMRSAIQAAGGATRAAEIIEQIALG